MLGLTRGLLYSFRSQLGENECIRNEDSNERHAYLSLAVLQETLFGGVWITCYEGGRNAASGTSQASSFHKRHLFSGLRVFWSLWMLGLPLEVFWMLFKNRINPWRKCFAYSSWHYCFERVWQLQLPWAHSNKVMLIMTKNGPEMLSLHFWYSKIMFSLLVFV